MLVGISIVLLAAYLAFVVWMIFHWPKAEMLTKSTNTTTTFSVIVPFRNEAERLQKTLEALNEVNYPRDLWDVIFVDDHSEDLGKGLIEANPASYRRQVLASEGEGKKSALATGIAASTASWVVTLDADTVVGPSWLRSIASGVEANKAAKVLVLPVYYRRSDKPLHQFFALEFLSLMGSGLSTANGGRPIMANGANFAFARSLYDELGGYGSHAHMSSGDDVLLLLEAHRRDARRVVAWGAAEGAAQTEAPDSWRQWFAQRVRWGSKSKAYGTSAAYWVALLVFLTNFWLIVLGVGVLFLPSALLPLVVFFVLKLIVDAVFMVRVVSAYNQRHLLVWLPVLALAYPLLLSLSVLLGLTLPVKWKGRKVSL